MPESSPEPSLGALLAPIGGFLAKFGLGTFIALIFLWWTYEDRRNGIAAAALQLKDMNGQIQQLSDKLVQHHDDTRKTAVEQSRILLAQCVNLANDRAERERCISGDPLR